MGDYKTNKSTPLVWHTVSSTIKSQLTSQPYMALIPSCYHELSQLHFHDTCPLGYEPHTSSDVHEFCRFFILNRSCQQYHTSLHCQYLISFLPDPMVLILVPPPLFLLHFRSNSWFWFSSFELWLLSLLGHSSICFLVNTFSRASWHFISAQICITATISKFTLILQVKCRPCLHFAWGTRNAYS